MRWADRRKRYEEVKKIVREGKGKVDFDEDVWKRKEDKKESEKNEFEEGLIKMM